MYLSTVAFIVGTAMLTNFTSGWSRLLLGLVCGGTIMQLLASLIAVQWAYDLSDLFKSNWIENAISSVDSRPLAIATINAGFDEVSEHIIRLFKNSTVQSLDFYDPESTTEPSITRARKLYPSPVPAIRIDASNWNINRQYELIFIMFAANEIRTQSERIEFFKQVRMHLAPKSESGDSKVILVEHLRNVPNFMVFNIGAFHFYSFTTWKSAWSSAGLRMSKSFSISPFIEVMILEADDNE